MSRRKAIEEQVAPLMALAVECGLTLTTETTSNGHTKAVFHHHSGKSRFVVLGGGHKTADWRVINNQVSDAKRELRKMGWLS